MFWGSQDRLKFTFRPLFTCSPTDRMGSMRLTLRTLMAYHHGVLAPQDHADLHHRIQASPDAGNLLRRIDMLTKSSQLLSPPLVSKGPVELGGDPNSIAEYLDDALNGAIVPDLERVCLERDMHLAELAHCHELLATAMKTQIAVPDLLRQNAIKLADPNERETIESQLLTRTTKRVARSTSEMQRMDRPHADMKDDAAIGNSVGVSAPMVASGGESIRPQGLSLEDTKLSHEVPEYLIGSSRGRWKIPVAIAGLAALLGLLIWQTLGPWEHVRSLFLATPTVGQGTEEPPLVVRELPPVNAEQAEPDDSVFNELIVSEEMPPLATAPDAQPSAASSGAGVETSDEAPPMPAAVPPSGADAIESSDDAPPLPPAASDTTDAPATGSNGSATWVPASDSVGELVLLKSSSELERLTPNGHIQSDAMLICLPTTSGSIELPNEVTWMTRGASRLSVDTSATPCTITTPLCRAMIKSQAAGKLVIATRLGPFEISLPDGNSIVSIEVCYRQIAPGSVIDRRAFVPAVIVIAAEGSAKVSHRHGQGTDSHELSIGEGVAVVEGSILTKFRLANIPNWFRLDNLRPIDYLAAEDLSRLAVAKDGVPFEQTLDQLTGFRRPETASLAIQAAMLAGDWSPFIGMLQSDRYRSHWATALNLARQVLAIAPDESDSIRNLFLDKFGVKQGDELFQMLCGLSEDQLSGDGVSVLISQLDSDTLANRVLAAHQLELLTGQTMAYQPHAPNRSSIQQWRRDAATKKLSLLPLVDPIVEKVSP